jgi:3-oxoacyl-(acyl-carrier-protein) synthase
MLKSVLLIILFPFLAFSAASWKTLEPFHLWSLDRAVKLLNDSPWARQETYTRVIKGVGSGISGEKEIYNTFYVRFLSARPVREAYARIQQIQHGYDSMVPDRRAV